jgi:HK97 family phage prohead protease
MSTLSHKQVDATATPTIEKGTAVLLVAAYSRDRGNDVIQRGAFRSTIGAWIDSGKQIPLAWDHSTDQPEQLICTVDPGSMRETRDGLIAEAHLDLDGSATAREVWRLVKSDSIGVSFGYLVTDKEDAGDGTRLLKAIDLFEVSLTAVPMNGDTRVVSWKSARREDDDWAFQRAEASAERALQNLRSTFADVLGPMPQHDAEAKKRDHNRRIAARFAKEIEQKEAKRARLARPIKVARFEV